MRPFFCGLRSLQGARNIYTTSNRYESPPSVYTVLCDVSSSSTHNFRYIRRCILTGDYRMCWIPFPCRCHFPLLLCNLKDVSTRCQFLRRFHHFLYRTPLMWLLSELRFMCFLNRLETWFLFPGFYVRNEINGARLESLHSCGHSFRQWRQGKSHDI
jgi:hypothetical protein